MLERKKVQEHMYNHLSSVLVTASAVIYTGRWQGDQPEGAGKGTGAAMTVRTHGGSIVAQKG